MRKAVLLVAGGVGSRFDKTIPKQFTKFKNQYIIEYTLDIFKNHFDKIVIVINPEHQSFLKSTEQIEICFGGATRQHSVLQGLLYLQQYNPDIVIIHDAVRMLVSERMIKDSVDTAIKYDSAIPVLPVTDSLWKKDNDTLSEQLNRNDYLCSQTPQTFNYQKILHAHQLQQEQLSLFSDCAGVYCSVFHKAYTYLGDKYNIKLTVPEDLKLIEFLLFHNN